MGDQNSGLRSVSDKLKSIQNLGLASTNPYFISDTALHDLGDMNGYIIYVLTTAVLGAQSVIQIGGNPFIGVSLSPGYYHVISRKIQLDSGSVIIYRG